MIGYNPFQRSETGLTQALSEMINRRDDRLDRCLHSLTSPRRKKRKPPRRKSCLKCSSISEQKLESQLHQPRRVRVYNLPECGTKIADVSIHCLCAEKLGVIEHVEGFDAKLQRFGFG
jgi:hypothetical protein